MNNQYPQKYNDEIDLFELIITLWKGKYIILSITMLSTVIAALFAFVIIQPLYQSETKITPPFLYQIDALNGGVINNPTSDRANYSPTLSPIDANSVYNTLINSINSTNLQRHFFEKYYIPRQADAIEPTQANFEAFQKMITIKLISKEQNHYSIAITTHSPTESYQLVNDLMTLANNTAKEVVIKNRTTEISTLINNIKNILNSMEIEISAQKTNEINTLKNSLTIAEKLGIKTPSELVNEPYMQGIEVLSNRIEFLEKNKNNFSDNAQYNGLMANLNMYQKITLPSLESFNTYHTDALSYVPEKPIKPNKKIIVLIGLLLGSISGGLIVLIYTAVQNWKQQQDINV